ncbi:Hypp1172 [Branchiostoma lanceolatum]|uniref:Hypp1172 protein n=1 Tax=Branchiostoma lanceolatum TaxID=7740 RepID=A0A8K0ELT6_BRALA|nr:Hypp1172 [Branchiostoma lanceolatum]
MALRKEESSKDLGKVASGMIEAIATIKGRAMSESAIPDNAALLKEVKIPYCKFVKRQRRYLSDRLALEDVGAPQLFVNEIEWLLTRKVKSTKPEEEDHLRKIYHCCDVLSSTSQTFAEGLAKAGIVPVLVGELDKYLSSNQFDRWKTPDGTIPDILAILYNLSKYASNRGFFRASKAVESLKIFVLAPLHPEAHVVLAMANVMSIEDFNKDKNLCQRIITLITRLSKQIDPDRIEGATDLAAGIARIAVYDSEQNLLAGGNLLTFLIKLMMLEVPRYEDETLSAIWAISQLAFHPGNREKILQFKHEYTAYDPTRSYMSQRKSQEFIPLLKELKESKNPAMIAAAATRALWELHDAEARRPTFMSNTTIEKHVMLSYHWEESVIANQMKNTLQTNGYKVHMEAFERDVSTYKLEAMAEAVDNAAAVLVCMSQKDEESADCRRVCEYAKASGIDIIPVVVEDQYKPDAWLGKLCETNPHFNLSSGGNFENDMAWIMSKLGEKRKDEARLKFKKEIQTWKQKNNIEGNLEKLEREDLIFLHKAKEEAPSEFYKWIGDELGQTTISRKRKFCNALENLESFQASGQ